MTATKQLFGLSLMVLAGMVLATACIAPTTSPDGDNANNADQNVNADGQTDNGAAPDSPGDGDGTLPPQGAPDDGVDQPPPDDNDGSGVVDNGNDSGQDGSDRGDDPNGDGSDNGNGNSDDNGDGAGGDGGDPGTDPVDTPDDGGGHDGGCGGENCDDGVDCTVDLCVQGSCVSAPNNSICDDNNDCTSDHCDVLLGCQHDLLEGCAELQLTTVDMTADLAICADTAETAADDALSVCEVIAMVSNPSNRVLSVGHAAITTNDPQGFYQHQFGGNTAPLTAVIDFSPAVVCDSFVSIGVAVSNGTDGTATDPDFDSDAFNNSGNMGDGGWYNSNPTNGQGEGGQVILGHFAVREGYTVSGELTVYLRLSASGEILPVVSSFECFGD